jgi:hypothetical protein
VRIATRDPSHAANQFRSRLSGEQWRSPRIVRGVDLAQPIGNGIAALKVACGTAWQFDHFIDALHRSRQAHHAYVREEHVILVSMSEPARSEKRRRCAQPPHTSGGC